MSILTEALLGVPTTAHIMGGACKDLVGYRIALLDPARGLWDSNSGGDDFVALARRAAWPRRRSTCPRSGSAPEALPGDRCGNRRYR